MNGQASALPKFREIAEQIRRRILSGELRAGAEIPSERALALEYDVSRPTATRALELLRHEGLVQSVRGSGTFVTDVAINRRPRDRYQRAKRAGRIYSDGERAEITSAELVEHPPEHVIRALKLDPNVSAIRRRRIIWHGDEPVEVSVSWFSATLAATSPRLLSTERIRLGTVAYVEDTSGRRPTYARDRMSARAAGSDDARALKLPKPATPVLLVEHLVFDDRDAPLEFVEAVYPPGHWTHEQRYVLG